MDDNSIRIGLSQSGSIQYQDSKTIIANTSIAQRINFESYYMSEPSNQIHTEITYNQWVYIKDGNTLRKLTNENMKEYINIQIGPGGNMLQGKGTLSNCTVEYTESNETRISYYYNIVDGDNGNFWSNIYCLTNIAGNYVEGEYDSDGNHKHWLFCGPEISTLSTPYAISATVDIGDTNNAPEGYTWQQRYLKAGKKIRIGILYNEPVYKDKNKAQLEKEAAYITITFRNTSSNATSDKQAKLVEWNNNNTYLVYEYVIQDGDRNCRLK